MIMGTTRCSDDMHALMANYCWRASVAHGSSDEGFAIDDFHTLREKVSMMRTDYRQLLTDRDYLLGIGDMYHRALREQELEVDRLTQELESTRGFLRGTQTTLQESESRSEELLEEIRQRSISSILVDSQICPLVTWLEDVGGLAEEHRLMEDTSIWVVDLQVEVDPVGRPGSMMQLEHTRDDMSMQGHTVMSDSSQRHAEICSQIQTNVLDCREETHLGEYQQLEKLLSVAPDDWGLVMTTGEHLSWVPIDVLLVESLGLTKEDGIFQCYDQL
jgi:hypothetical protein